MGQPNKFRERTPSRIVHELFAERFFPNTGQEYMPAPERGGKRESRIVKRYYLEVRAYMEVERGAALAGVPIAEYFNTVLHAELEKRGFSLYRATASMAFVVLATTLTVVVATFAVREIPSVGGSEICLLFFATIGSYFGLQAAGRKVNPDLRLGSRGNQGAA